MSRSSEIYGEQTQIIWGGRRLFWKAFLDYEFSLSLEPLSTESEQTEVLYSEAVKALMYRQRII